MIPESTLIHIKNMIFALLPRCNHKPRTETSIKVEHVWVSIASRFGVSGEYDGVVRCFLRKIDSDPELREKIEDCLREINGEDKN